MWACLTKLWHWYTQTLKIDYTVLNLLFYTEQHMCNVVKLEIFWFSFTIIRQNYQSFYITYSYTFFPAFFYQCTEKKRKNQTEALFFKFNILTCPHRILLKLNPSDEGWKEYEDFTLLISLNSDSQNCGQHCDAELNLLGFMTGES